MFRGATLTAAQYLDGTTDTTRTLVRDPRTVLKIRLMSSTSEYLQKKSEERSLVS
jgi:hypothetical protein